MSSSSLQKCKSHSYLIKKIVVDQFAKLLFKVMLSNTVADQLVTHGYWAYTSVAEVF